MKYIFLIIIAFLLVQEIPAQVRLSTMDSVTTFQPTDLFWLNTKPSASFVNRKVSWSYLRSNMIDYIDGLANTWALRQTFTGATFGSGSNGSAIFQDSVNMVSATVILANYIDRTVAASRVGTTANPYLAMYARNFVIPNTEGNDSVYISYDDSTLSIDKKISIANLEITDQLELPDSASFSGWALSETVYQPPFATDSIITLSSMCSSILLDPPASMGSPGIEKITLAGAGNGQILVITNRQALSVVFQDNEADGNLNIATDFTMAQYDILMLKYNSYTQKWYEVSRSDN